MRYCVQFDSGGCQGWIRGPGGGGVLCLEKGTDCGPTAGERWRSRPATAEKGGLSRGLSLYHIVGKRGLSESVQLIFPIK